MAQALQGTMLGIIGGSSLFRAGLSSMVQLMEFHSVVEAPSLLELPALLREAGCEAPGLLILQTKGGAGHALSMVAEARSLFPAARLVLMSETIDLEIMARCFAAGLDGYLMEDIGRQSLVDSLRLVQRGEKVFPSRLAGIIEEYRRQISGPQLSTARLRASRLSEREGEILRLLVTGDPNKLIALRLKISEATVKVHMKSILKKTQARNRTEAALWAITGNRSWGTEPAVG